MVPVDRLSGRRILVVDEHALVRAFLCEVLTRFGMDVTAVDRGGEAIRALSSASTPFDLALVNWRAVDMDGEDLIRQVRGHPLFGAIPLIFMVASSQQDDAQRRANDLQIDGLLVKPVLPAVLLEAILNALGGAVRKSRRVPDRAPSGQRSRLRGRHILVVEDNEVNQEIAREILSGEGARVQVVADGVAAVSAVETSTLPFDVVLMDIHMPVMDGYEATRRIRGNPAHARLPILAMTASVMTEERERCTAAGMNDHISKPFDVDQAIATLNHWMAPLEPDGKQEEGTTTAPPATGTAAPPATGTTAESEPSAAPSSGSRNLFDLPGFDVPAALLRLNGNEALLRKLLLSFAENNATLASRVRATLDAGDLDGAFRLVHAVKGASGNLGAVQLFKIAEAFQTVLIRRDGEAIPSHFEQFRQRLNYTLAALGRLAPREESDAPPLSSPEWAATAEQREHLVSECLQLIELMGLRSMRAVAFADTFLKKLQGGGFEPEVRALEAALAVLDFNAGCNIAQTLVGKLR
ncbi:MAG: response regulator [Alphaproteobacteria bacterium]